VRVHRRVKARYVLARGDLRGHLDLDLMEGLPRPRAQAAADRPGCGPGQQLVGSVTLRSDAMVPVLLLLECDDLDVIRDAAVVAGLGRESMVASAPMS
jgi:hypothetical protein